MFRIAKGQKKSRVNIISGLGGQKTITIQNKDLRQTIRFGDYIIRPVYKPGSGRNDQIAFLNSPHTISFGFSILKVTRCWPIPVTGKKARNLVQGCWQSESGTFLPDYIRHLRILFEQSGFPPISSQCINQHCVTLCYIVKVQISNPYFSMYKYIFKLLNSQLSLPIMSRVDKHICMQIECYFISKGIQYKTIQNVSGNLYI